jgi:uncharacterized protein DUF3562
MSRDVSLEPVQAKANDTAVATIARETETSTDVVKALYEEEVATLTEHATVRQFIGVIATRRVRQQLRSLQPPH